MLRKNKRILWLLNHKTLMPYETRLLERLGYEVFTPKIIPNDVTFRSGAVSFDCDAGLTLPPDVLRRLNAFDFYSGTWPSDITFHVNRYFGTAFVMPLRDCFREVLLNFEGQILLRAFGLDNTLSYEKVLRLDVGRQAFSWIHAAGERFWFAQGYEQLAECEPPLLADRAVYLPLGVPAPFWRSSGQWTGSRREILFVCPNLVTNPYYANVYREFKQAFGDLPHVIVGAQDVPVDDPHVLGFVTDERLDALYRECAVLFYHSREKRHVHYSPIEAAIVGMPIVFYSDSLLARLVGHRMQGAVDGIEEGRALLRGLLDGDIETVRRLREDQASIGTHFSDTHCVPAWEAVFGDDGPLGKALRAPTWLDHARREAIRSLRYRQRLGLSEPRQPLTEPARDALTPPGAAAEIQTVAYESLAWFDSIDLGDGRVTPGAAPRDVFLARADRMLEDVKPGDALLDVGEGEGLYAFEAERRGLQDVTFVSLMNVDGFRYAKRQLRSQVKEASANLYQLDGIHGGGFDVVLLRSVLNQVEAPLLLLQAAARTTRRLLVVEAMLDLQDQDRPLCVYYGAERGVEGMPSTGWGFNRQFVDGALRELGFVAIHFEPTPDSPGTRGIFVATRGRTRRPS